MRWVLFGGENFTLKYLKEIVKKLPQAQFSNVYGPAEVNQCTYYNFNVTTPIGSYLPIGSVWENTEYKVLGENDGEVTKVDSGELVIHSTTMMQGYWKNTDLTKKSLYTNRFSENTEKIYYRTGDIVRTDEQGNLVFLGRKDRQVKVRGYRIELDEIEAILDQHQAVKESTVCIIEKGNEKQLAAVVILMQGSATQATDLISFCRSKLPMYAVPQRLEIIDDFPRTGSGKIDLTQIKEELLAL